VHLSGIGLKLRKQGLHRRGGAEGLWYLSTGAKVTGIVMV